VRLFYFLLPFLVFGFANNSPNRLNFEPWWANAWIEWIGLEFSDAFNIMRAACITLAIAGVFIHRYRAGRILICMMLWQIHAFESSFGSINHQWYPWLYVSFAFIFLPGFRHTESVEYRRQFLLYLWTGQAIVAGVYSLAGLHKLVYAYLQAQEGLIHAFHPWGFSYQVADWIPKLQQEAILSSFVVEHPFVVAPFYMVFVVIQFFSWWIMVRPSLQQAWACVFILFHMGTRFTMGIEFPQWMILVTILFLPSPFVNSASIRELWEDLPTTVFSRALLNRPRTAPKQ